MTLECTGSVPFENEGLNTSVWNENATGVTSYPFLRQPTSND